MRGKEGSSVGLRTWATGSVSVLNSWGRKGTMKRGDGRELWGAGHSRGLQEDPGRQLKPTLFSSPHGVVWLPPAGVASLQPGLGNRPREVLRAIGPEPKRECHQSRLSTMAQVFGKCHGAGPFNPVACILSAGLGLLIKFKVPANIN